MKLMYCISNGPAITRKEEYILFLEGHLFSKFYTRFEGGVWEMFQVDFAHHFEHMGWSNYIIKEITEDDLLVYLL